MKHIAFTGEYITLGQFLKLADCISTGGMAKPFLAETPVYVNGEPEQRRGRKLYPQDSVKVETCGEFMVVSEAQH